MFSCCYYMYSHDFEWLNNSPLSCYNLYNNFIGYLIFLLLCRLFCQVWPSPPPHMIVMAFIPTSSLFSLFWTPTLTWNKRQHVNNSTASALGTEPNSLSQWSASALKLAWDTGLCPVFPGSPVLTTGFLSWSFTLTLLPKGYLDKWSKR